MKKLSTLQAGTHFMYGGVEWVKLGKVVSGGVLALSATCISEQAFDAENCNDWRKSSLRRELNGPFLDALVSEGADRAAFMDWESDLTADDGMTDYGTATDKIALLSDSLYRQFRAIIPILDGWYWTLTPWSCKEEYKAYVRGVRSSGALSYNSAYYGHYGVRPLCYLNSEILVSIPEEDKEAERNSYDEAVSAARDDILNMLNAYPVEVWGDALGAAVASLFRAKLDAAEISEEEKTKAAEG